MGSTQVGLESNGATTLSLPVVSRTGIQQSWLEAPSAPPAEDLLDPELVQHVTASVWELEK